MHTDETLQIIEGIMVSLGRELHVFSADTCATFLTHELRHEAEG